MGLWVCEGSFWRPWALHVGSLCHQRSSDANGALLNPRTGGGWFQFIAEFQNALPTLEWPIQHWSGFSHAFGGPRARFGPSPVWGWAPQVWHFLLFLLFSCSRFWAPPKNSGPNPISFQFLMGVPWAPWKLPPWENPGYATEYWYLATSVLIRPSAQYL